MCEGCGVICVCVYKGRVCGGRGVMCVCGCVRACESIQESLVSANAILLILDARQSVDAPLAQEGP